MDKVCYVYAIIHIASGKRYVGTTIDIKSRWSHHRAQLRHNHHHCAYLQNAWNKYGETAFEFSILKQLHSNDKLLRTKEELSAIAEFLCYNSRIASLGLTNFENADHVRQKISEGIQKLKNTDINYVEKMRTIGINVAELAKTPEARLKRSILTKELWNDEKHRHSVSRALAKHWSKPGVREEHSKRVKEVRARPEVKEAIEKALKAAWENPNSGLNNRSDGRWNNKAAFEEVSKRMTNFHEKNRQAKRDAMPKIIGAEKYENILSDDNRAQLGTLKQSILELLTLNPNGLTTYEIVFTTHFKNDSVRGTLTKLKQDGIIEKLADRWVIKVV